jgi:hypothetical protein
MDPDTLNMMLGVNNPDPLAAARNRHAALQSMSQATPEQQAAVSERQNQMLSDAQDRSRLGALMSGAGDRRIARMGASAERLGAGDEKLAYQYGPEQRQALLQKAMAAALGKSGAALTAGEASMGKQGLANVGGAVKAQITADARLQGMKILHDSPAGQLVKREDGSLFLINKKDPNAAPTPIMNADGSAFQQRKELGPTEVKQLGTYDAALSRLDKLEELFKKGIGTYPGAGTVHDIANIFGAQDPQFDALRSLSKSHLFKGLKSDIGGRITNFEIKYGNNMFPNEADRVPTAMAKIALIREQMTQDKEQDIKNLQSAGRNTTGFTGHAPRPAAHPHPVAAPVAPAAPAAPADDLRKKYGL